MTRTITLVGDNRSSTQGEFNLFHRHHSFEYDFEFSIYFDRHSLGADHCKSYIYFTGIINVFICMRKKLDKAVLGTGHYKLCMRDKLTIHFK